ITQPRVRGARPPPAARLRRPRHRRGAAQGDPDMLTYHLQNALRSLRRTPILTALLVGGIALGICVSTAFVTLRHMYQQDPLPGKTDRMFYVRLDSWGKDHPFKRDDPDSLPDQITYKDARALMR